MREAAVKHFKDKKMMLYFWHMPHSAGTTLWYHTSSQAQARAAALQVATAAAAAVTGIGAGASVPTPQQQLLLTQSLLDAQLTALRVIVATLYVQPNNRLLTAEARDKEFRHFLDNEEPSATDGAAFAQLQHEYSKLGAVQVFVSIHVSIYCVSL